MLKNCWCDAVRFRAEFFSLVRSGSENPMIWLKIHFFGKYIFSRTTAELKRTGFFQILSVRVLHFSKFPVRVLSVRGLGYDFQSVSFQSADGLRPSTDWPLVREIFWVKIFFSKSLNSLKSLNFLSLHPLKS